MFNNNEFVKKIGIWKEKNTQKEMEIERMKYQMNEQKNYKDKSLTLKAENRNLKEKLQSQQDELAQKANTIMQLNKTISKYKSEQTQRANINKPS